MTLQVKEGVTGSEECIYVAVFVQEQQLTGRLGGSCGHQTTEVNSKVRKIVYCVLVTIVTCVSSATDLASGI